MALTSNELLYEILLTLGRIENSKKAPGAPATPGSPSAGREEKSTIPSFFSYARELGKISKKQQKSFFEFLKGLLSISGKSSDKEAQRLLNISASLKNIGDSLPGIAAGMKGFGGLFGPAKVRASMDALAYVTSFVEQLGTGSRSRRIKSGVKSLKEIAGGLKEIAKPIKDISMSLLYIAGGILAFALSLVATAAILGKSDPMDVLVFMGMTIFALVAMFGVIWLAKGVVKEGGDVIVNIGLGMVTLALGIVAFALLLRFLPAIIGKEAGGSIWGGIKTIALIIGTIVLAFAVIGFFSEPIKRGIGVVFMMSLGVLALGVAILFLAQVAKALIGGSFLGGKKEQGEKDQNKKDILNGLGMIGLIILASVALFTLLGITPFNVLILAGIGVAIAMSIAIILLAYSVKKIAEASKEVGDTESLKKNISSLIGATIEGFLGGITSLSGEGNAVQKTLNFIKNSAKIFAAVGVLSAMSMSISLFAKAISAFAQLGNIRIIEGYDKDGKPIFGDRIDVVQVAKNLSESLKVFLSSLIEATVGLTTKEARAIKKMGRALTGRRGILSAVVQFADVLKVFSEFGPNGEIGYMEYEDTGKADEDGNPIYRERRSKVLITDVVNNIVTSFMAFVSELVTRSREFELEGTTGKKMKKLGTMLLGSKGFLGIGKDPGLLTPILKFAETLEVFAKYGKTGKMPIFDKDGKVTGSVTMEEVGSIIIDNLTKFVNKIGGMTVSAEFDKAEANVKKFEGVMDKLGSIASSASKLDKLRATFGDLAKSVTELSLSLEKLDDKKLDKLLQPVSKAISGEVGSVSGPVQDKNKIVQAAGGSEKTNWDEIADKIGKQVGTQIASSIRAGQIKFEFSPTGGNKGVILFE